MRQLPAARGPGGPDGTRRPSRVARSPVPPGRRTDHRGAAGRRGDTAITARDPKAAVVPIRLADPAVADLLGPGSRVDVVSLDPTGEAARCWPRTRWS